MLDNRLYIQEQIKKKGISIYALAKAAGLHSRATLYKYLKGADIRISTLDKILKALENTTSKK